MRRRILKHFVRCRFARWWSAVVLCVATRCLCSAEEAKPADGAAAKITYEEHVQADLPRALLHLPRSRHRQERSAAG